MTSQQSYQGESSKRRRLVPADSSLTIFDYEDLEEATNFFDASLMTAKDVYGVVYRGKLRNGKTVAVKSMRRFFGDDFSDMVKTLSCLHHESLVTVYGCTKTRSVLVYEFVPTLSVADHLKHRMALSWPQRMEIAIETAEVIIYLHSNHVIHGNITTDDLKLKVAGFGCLLNLGNWIYEYANSFYRRRETGYLKSYEASKGADFYSFGVVLLELMLGRRVVVVQEKNYKNRVLGQQKNKQLEQLVDPELDHLSNQDIQRMVTLLVKLASRCLHPNKQSRPLMPEVLMTLKNIKNGNQLSETSASSAFLSAPQVTDAKETVLLAVRNVRGTISSVTQASKDLTEEESEPIDFNLNFIFKYEDLQEATQNFNVEIGKGGSGKVYRGKLESGLTVAVKKLSEHHPELTEFLNEVWILSGLRHKNLIQLYGCTNPEDEKLLLVYEFVSNGTLADHLHRKPEESLSWSRRIQMAIDTAEAIAYLHSLRPTIVHLDIKTDNLLLDDDFIVKVADFGMCCLLPPDGSSRVSTMPRGTQGYLDPEYKQLNKFTAKSDVYSFGVVLLELISGMAALDTNRDEVWLVNMASNKMKNNLLEQLVDPKLGYDSNKRIRSMITSVAKLASRCLQVKGIERPSMLEALMILKDIRDDMQMVKKTAVDSLESLSVAFEAFENSLVASNPSLPHGSDTMIADTEDAESTLPLVVLSFVEGSDLIGVATEEELQIINFDLPFVFKSGILLVGRQTISYWSERRQRRYGKVGHGNLQNGLKVTVKTLEGGFQHDTRQVLNKAWILYGLRHKNLVVFYGCTNPVTVYELTNPNGLGLHLVYEFLPNGTVADHLHTMSWIQRIQIAIQAAKALVYLHSRSTPIIHCDFKTDNLLLDNNFNVKVDDFGLCHLAYLYKSPNISSKSWGTQEYRDPECNFIHDATTKSDVYSFGVVLVELITEKTALGLQLGTNNTVNIQRIQSMLQNLVGPQHRGQFEQVISLAELAISCLQFEGERRPSMPAILKILKDIKLMKHDTTTFMESFPGATEVLRNALLTAPHNAAHVEGAHIVSTEEESQISESELPIIFKYEELEEATNFFNPTEMIGEGVYGLVFRGNLKDGLRVAVKRLSRYFRPWNEQFLNEARLLYGLGHKNLVKFYGCTKPEDTCPEELLLVYEFMPNGTVAHHLHRQQKQKKKLSWSWAQRIKIAIQAAKALVYLHSLPTPVIHCDIKTDNLLLDDNFNVKVGDFGLFRLLSFYESSHISLMPHGTQVYLPPECKQVNDATTKSDVYSFGVVLVELITGDTARHLQLGTNKDNIHFIQSMLQNLVDPQLRGHFELVSSLADLAKSCLQFEGERRPPMPEILMILKDIRDMKQDTTTSMESLPASDEVLRNALLTAHHDAMQIENANDTISYGIDTTDSIDAAR